MLALLLLVVLVAVGCVLWFMGEAMRNERMAVREKLAEAYRGHLSLVQKQVVERWERWRGQLDRRESPSACFARCISEALADAVIVYDEHGRVGYPREPRLNNSGVEKAVSLQANIRTLAQTGKLEEATRLVADTFKATDSTTDEQGRLIAANAELLIVDLSSDRTEPRVAQIAERLHSRLTDYSADVLPSSQRRFLMHELQRLDPGLKFPTLEAEDLAARYLETPQANVADASLHATSLHDTWAIFSADRSVTALLTTARLHTWLAEATREPSLPQGVVIRVLAPGEDLVADRTPIVLPMGSELPGWRLALLLDDRSLFDVETARRLKLHVAVASMVIAAMSILALLVARGVGRQVALARLKNDLVATVSHEFKTPLTAMRALVDTLLDTETFEEKTVREYLRLLAQENMRLSRLIDNFLTFSRLERNKFKFEFAPIYPRDVVDETLKSLGDRLQAPGCRFEVHTSENLPTIMGDTDSLVTALLNLLDNAWKYTGDEKQVVLRTEARGNRVCFAVEDNGIGLSPSESLRVFQRFYQVDQSLSRSAGGCGLGLSIVQSIAEAHHGAVHVTSAVGRGSTFTIEIPAIPKNRA